MGATAEKALLLDPIGQYTFLDGISNMPFVLNLMGQIEMIGRGGPSNNPAPCYVGLLAVITSTMTWTQKQTDNQCSSQSRGVKCTDLGSHIIHLVSVSRCSSKPVPCTSCYTNTCGRWQGHEWMSAGSPGLGIRTSGLRPKVVQSSSQPWLPFVQRIWVVSSIRITRLCTESVWSSATPHKTKDVKFSNAGGPKSRQCWAEASWPLSKSSSWYQDRISIALLISPDVSNLKWGMMHNDDTSHHG